MRRTQEVEKVHESSGNVFADLALDQPRDRLVKAELAHQICQAVAARLLTQTKAGEIMGLDQPKVSALMHGKLKGFSVERLFQCLNDLGHEIRITIGPARQGSRRGDTYVVAVAM
jgi:predicted XRE-type DNA-binding protein